MALSHEEQRLLEQLEQALAAEDPKLAHALRGAGTHTIHRRRAALSGLGFLAGITALVAGMETSVVVSVIGFVIMLISTVVAISSWQRVSPESAVQQPQGARQTSESAFIDKLEERFRRGDDQPLN